MSEGHKGVIYIFTNPSFPEYVKIGYARNVQERLAQPEYPAEAAGQSAGVEVAVEARADMNIRRLLEGVELRSIHLAQQGHASGKVMLLNERPGQRRIGVKTPDGKVEIGILFGRHAKGLKKGAQFVVEMADGAARAV
ncbi:MAG: GIY-YIG nuclease family protein, partial [Clostridia bacterium]|nr:GIY-YIG nuclease family protein [Clostridia bacterium]